MQIKQISRNLKGVNNYIVPVAFILIVFMFFWNKAKAVVTTVGNVIDEAGSTLTDVELDSIWSQLEYLIRGITKDSDEQKIIDILSQLSLPDYNRLKNRVGLKWYSKTLRDWGVPYISSHLNLTQILAHELDDWAKQSLREVAPHLNLF